MVNCCVCKKRRAVSCAYMLDVPFFYCKRCYKDVAERLYHRKKKQVILRRLKESRYALYGSAVRKS